MRLKTTPLSCAFAWAPSGLGTPTFLAAASLAGAMDDDFSNEAFLEIRLVDVTQTDETDMPVVGRTLLKDRAFRVDWCLFGGECGMIAVACCNGAVYVYDAGVMMKNYQMNPSRDAEEPLLCTISEHRGAVRGCQFNPSQPNFLAIGADDGEWDVWTLEDPREPQRVPVMSNAAHSASIVHLQWHPKYPHIIATASSNSVVNVWNLKSQTLAVSLNVSKGNKSGLSANAIAWHPTVATQLAVALDEKDCAIQIWDLKKSMVPLRELRGHEGAVTGLAWNSEDASMMASCSTDGKTIWWDPSTGERSGALQQENSYVIDVQWSPVLPAVLATSSFEPLFCVSTAEDASCTPATGTAVPKWLKKRRGASVSLGGFVASLIPNSTTKVGLTHLTGSSAVSPTTSLDLAFREALRRFPRDSEERVEWLKAQNYQLLAAAAACKEDRTPILAYLNEDTSSHDDGEDPFETMQASQKSLEDIAAAHIAAGRIREAVEVCLDNGRYDDAFAIAYLQGGALLQRVHQEYSHYILNHCRERRHVVYASAIASGDFDSLTAGENVPWKETLSVIISFVGDGFSDACDKLGAALKKKGNTEGAITCFVCSGNVDAVMQIWCEENTPVRKMMREALLLEEVTGRRVTSSFFADSLYEYGMRLVGDGLLTEGTSILQRSASIGNRAAAIMVDRLKFQVPVGQVPFPFTMMPLSDSPSPSCVNFMREGQQQQQPRVQPQQQSQQQQQFPMSMQQQQQRQSPMPSQNLYSRQQPQQPQPQQPFSPLQGVTGPRPGVPGMPPAPGTVPNHVPTTTTTTTTTTLGSSSAAPAGPRLMPHPISAYSSMKQGGPVSSGPSVAAAAVSDGYSNGIPPGQPRQQSQLSAPGGYSAEQQNYVDPNRPVPPPPQPSVSRGPPMPGAAQPVASASQVVGVQLPPPPPQQQQQQPMTSQRVGAVMQPQPLPPPPLPPGVSLGGVVPQQQTGGGYSGNQQPSSRGSSIASAYLPTKRENAPVMNTMPLQGGAPSMYGNTTSATTAALNSNPSTSVAPPPPAPRQMMPSPGNTSSYGLAPKEDSLGSTQTNSRGMGNAQQYQSFVPPSNNGIPLQNTAPRSQTAAMMPPPPPAPSAYGPPSNAQKPTASGPYGGAAGGTFQSAMNTHGSPTVPFVATPGTTPGTADDANLSRFDISSLNPAYHALAQKLCADIQQVSNAQRRLVISKAALELFKLLQQGALSPDVVSLISNCVNSTGTPQAKNAWRKLSDAHFDVVQPFLNLKFLS